MNFDTAKKKRQQITRKMCYLSESTDDIRYLLVAIISSCEINSSNVAGRYFSTLE